MNKKNKQKVAVLGATGVVGQVFVHMLSNHKWFELSVITGSDSRAGKYYNEEVQWMLPVPMPESVKNKKLDALDMDSLLMPGKNMQKKQTFPPLSHLSAGNVASWVAGATRFLKERGVKIIFSALPSHVAKIVEPELREHNFYIFSNAGAMRYKTDVPILIPEVNPETLEWINKQGFPKKGFVITNANCSTTGLAVALAPLKKFGLREVFVSTYQSVSGAGYPGLSALDIMGNTIPYILKEEEKMIIELKKILQLEQDVEIYPHCVRIPVLFGHLETVWLTFEEPVEKENILEAWETCECKNANLPTLPHQPVVYIDDEHFPQPRMSFWGSPPGMQVFTGRLRKEKDKIGFTLLVNNLVKGAAGGSIANAELFLDAYGQGEGQWKQKK
jgi:aspartate-semialdehyde dehydrogenase